MKVAVAVTTTNSCFEKKYYVFWPNDNIDPEQELENYDDPFILIGHNNGQVGLQHFQSLFFGTHKPCGIGRSMGITIYDDIIDVAPPKRRKLEPTDCLDDENVDFTVLPFVIEDNPAYNTGIKLENDRNLNMKESEPNVSSNAGCQSNIDIRKEHCEKKYEYDCLQHGVAYHMPPESETKYDDKKTEERK